MNRNKGIGSSESAAALGLSPWSSPYEVWARKTGRIGERADTEAMEWGRLLEGPVALKYAIDNDVDLQMVDTEQHRYPTYSMIYASPDRRVSPEKLLEVKTGSHFMREHWGQPGTDEIPMEYFIQCQHQMSVFCEVQTVDVAVLIGGNEYREYTVNRQEEVIERLLDGLFNFWKLVTDDTPPPVNFHDKRIQDTVRKIRGNGQAVQAHPLLQTDIVNWQIYREERLKAEKLEKAAYARVEHALDGAEFVYFGVDDKVLHRKHVQYTKPAQEAKEIDYYTMSVKKRKGNG